MSVRRPVLTPDHPAPVAAAHRQAGYPLSLAGTTAPDHHPPVAGVVIWLAAYGGAALLVAIPARSGRAAAASVGLATGLLFDGDISAKLIGYGGLWLAGDGDVLSRRLLRASRHEPDRGGRRLREGHRRHRVLGLALLAVRLCADAPDQGILRLHYASSTEITSAPESAIRRRAPLVLRSRSVI